MRLTRIIQFLFLLPFVSCDQGIPIDSEKHLKGSIVFTIHDTAEQRSFIYRMNLEGGDISQLTFPDEMLDSVRSRGSASEPRWGPDGSRIVYSESLGPDESHVVMMNANGSNKKVLTPVGGYCIRPKWSPEGGRILYLRGTYTGAIIATSIVDTNGISFDVQLAAESRVFEGDSIFYNLNDAQWHQDGQHLYVWGSVGERPMIPVCGENAKGEIFLVNMETGRTVNRFTHNAVDECGFEISHDGTYIVFFRGPYQINQKIYLMFIAGSVITPITNGKNDYWPRWSSDGSLIVFLKDEDDSPWNDPSFSNRIYALRPEQPFKEIRISSLVANDPDVFVEP